MMERWGSLRGSAAALAGWFAVTALALPLAAATPVAKAAAVGTAGTRTHRGRRRRPRLGFDADKVRDAKPEDWLIRFVFGAGTSAVAGIVGATAGAATFDRIASPTVFALGAGAWAVVGLGAYASAWAIGVGE